MVNKKTKILFLTFLCLFGIGLFFNSFAQAPPRPLELDYPTIGGYQPTTIQQTLLPEYINYLFNFSLMIVGLIVFLALVLGGFFWLTSAGNPTKLSDAKERIFGALTGLVLLLCSWLILNTINPQLVTFEPFYLESFSNSLGRTGEAVIVNSNVCGMGSNCSVDEDCNPEVTGKKCYDVFANGNKICLSEQDFLSSQKVGDLSQIPVSGGGNWDNQAQSIILYGSSDDEVRVCDNADFFDCEIIKRTNTDYSECFPVANLSSFEVMKVPEGARLYSEKNYGGTHKDFPATQVGVECYKEIELGEIFLDASSIEVSSPYWAVLCNTLSNGQGCGWGGSNIFRDIYSASGDADGIGDPDLSNEIIGENKANKICVIEFAKGCGGVIVKGNNNKTDFIKRGEQFQFGIKEDTSLANDSMEGFYMYMPGCSVKIWEKAGSGKQIGSLRPDDDCGDVSVCCGRTWSSGILTKQDTFLDFSIAPGTTSCTAPPAPSCTGCNCTEYFESNLPYFSGYLIFNGTSTSSSINVCSKEEDYDCLCPYYGIHNCASPNPVTQCGFVMDCDYCKACENCHELNRIYKRASCIEVTQ